MLSCYYWVNKALIGKVLVLKKGKASSFTEDSPSWFKPGDVVMHYDGSSHIGILLKEKRPGFWLTIFFTSNSSWGIRLATKEEVALAGFYGGKRTYIALAGIKPDTEFSKLGYSFPKYRVMDMIKEFEKGIIHKYWR